jgi:hypothetical protein
MGLGFVYGFKVQPNNIPQSSPPLSCAPAIDCAHIAPGLCMARP